MESADIPVYEVPEDALKRPWVSHSLLGIIQYRRPAPRRHVAAASLSAAVSLILHTILIGTVVLGVARPRSPPTPDRQGPGASAVASDQEPVMTLIMINEPTPAPFKDLIPDPKASRGSVSLDLPVILLSPDALPSLDTNDQSDPDYNESPSTAPLDPAVHALLFGRYVGQISARIERVWLRPRTPIGADTFSCQVQIKQDHQGNVEDTTLENCNGNTRWQLSLVQAIQSASPLPAPPERRVFADAVTLQFSSKPYLEGGIDEGFEPGHTSRASRTMTQPLLHDQILDPNAPRTDPKSKVLIQLHIVGDHDMTTSSLSTSPSVSSEPRARALKRGKHP